MLTAGSMTTTLWGDFIDSTYYTTLSQVQIDIILQKICDFNWTDLSMTDCLASINIYCLAHETMSGFQKLICEYLSQEKVNKPDIIYRKHDRFYAVVVNAMDCWAHCTTKNLPHTIWELFQPPMWGLAQLTTWSDCYQEFLGYKETVAPYFTTKLNVPWDLQNKVTCTEGSRNLCG
jgi:hypothetical protein